MEKNLILAGVGGQGILTISHLLCQIALDKGWNFKQAEAHGMAQRGGAVQSHLRLSDQPIASELIPVGKADLVLGIEPLEVFRYTQYLKPDGLVITSTVPQKNIPGYPEDTVLMEWLNNLPHKILIETRALSLAIGSLKVQNMIILGAALPTLGFCPEECNTYLRELFGGKGDKIVEMNRQAVAAGYRAVQ